MSCFELQALIDALGANVVDLNSAVAGENCINPSIVPSGLKAVGGNGQITLSWNEVAAASTEHSNGIEQINRAIAELETVVQQNAAGAEESASTSEHMKVQAIEIKRAVDGLVELAGVREKKEVAGKPQSWPSTVKYQKEEDPHHYSQVA